MSLLPSWAPNLHPLVIHFPIVLVITAVAIDVMDTMFERPAWLPVMSTGLYTAAALAAVTAYLTGQRAADVVFVPGMAHPLIDDHRMWALATAWYVGVTAIARLAAARLGFPRARVHRVLLFAVGLIAVVLVQQTADRGARLVYEQGVGVIAAPGSP